MWRLTAKTFGLLILLALLGTWILTSPASRARGARDISIHTPMHTTAPSVPCSDLSFAQALGSPFPVGSVPISVVMGEFNNDGHLDLAIANSASNDVTVLLGNGVGGFSPAPGSPVAVGSTPYDIAVGDFNNDGDLDLVTANRDSADVTVLLGTGLGGFSPAPGSPFPAGSGPKSVAVGDFNNDGHLDLVTANSASNGVTVLLSDGLGGFFSAPFPVGYSPFSVAVGDFNGDSKLDLVTANYSSSDVTVLLGSGAGGFSEAPGSPFPVGSGPISVTVGDVNNDGHLDLATSHTQAIVTVLLGNGAGGLSHAPGSPFPIGTGAYDVGLGDFNGDGNADLAPTSAAAISGVRVLLGSGAGGFSEAPGSPFPVGTNPLSVAVGDFNGDGKLDLVTANAFSNDVTVLLNTCTTLCLIEFTDVPSTNTFYQFVRCLACQDIISGYADGTFRPNNLVTRGQLAKIVSNAAGFAEDPNPQIFEDVPSSGTFYEWINRLARRGHMSGYACGGAGEPCITGMPYFRPSANATRGQTSKIVSNAAGYSEILPDQTFEDVPPDYTFYAEIQRLASRNIMQGYACGGVGEPCVSGKPYFRPQNNVTRGQSAKILANTFFPGCETP